LQKPYFRFNLSHSILTPMLAYPRILTLFILMAMLAACKKNNDIPANLSVFPVIDTIGGTITITGSGFLTTPGDNMVKFNDSSFGVVLTATSTKLTVDVPGFITEGPIVVKNKNMESRSAEVFRMAPKFSPQVEAPGYPVYIITGGGSRLSDYTVSFNGVVTNPTGLINDQLTVTVPANAANGKIIVNYKGKPYTSLTDFTLAPVGSVTSLTTLGAFGQPAGLAFDRNGNLFVADLYAGMIDKVNTVNGSISAYAGNGSYNFNGGSPLLSAGIYGALNLAFAANGDMYATDQWYGPIWRITPDSAGYLLTPGQLFSPAGLYIDASGNLYITDAQKIKKISPAGIVSTLAGQATQGGQNGPAATASFLNPSSLVLDAAGNIYIADNSTIRLLSNDYVTVFAGGGGNGGYKDGIGLGAGFTSINSIAIDPATGNIFAMLYG
jgi:sugar lactone lactonase YvrE